MVRNQPHEGGKVWNGWIKPARPSGPAPVEGPQKPVVEPKPLPEVRPKKKRPYRKAPPLAARAAFEKKQEVGNKVMQLLMQGEMTKAQLVKESGYGKAEVLYWWHRFLHEGRLKSRSIRAYRWVGEP